jgi:hypothetical protein
MQLLLLDLGINTGIPVDFWRDSPGTRPEKVLQVRILVITPPQKVLLPGFTVILYVPVRKNR